MCLWHLEDSSHFLLYWPIDITLRPKMLQTRQTIININYLQVDTLLYGVTKCDFDTNKTVLKFTHQFILETTDYSSALFHQFCMASADLYIADYYFSNCSGIFANLSGCL